MSETTTETVLAPFKKSWPAMMLLVVICGIGYGAYQILQTVGGHVGEYVVASGQNLDALVKASTSGEQAHAQLEQALAHVMQGTRDTRDQVVINGEKLTELSKILKETADLLRNTPANQDAQMKALARIEAALTQMTDLLQNAPRIEAERLEAIRKEAARKSP